MDERLIPLAAMEKIIRDAGAERVSDDAKEALKELLEKKAEEISKKAVMLSIHAGRKTVKSSDVKLALKSSER
ncbi:histone family protein [Candidatus Woesearchaeota archaeon]|nr:histone family protein [Candidatus Woesearchaeota archaeon]